MTDKPNIIRQLRLAAGLTQVELAERLGILQSTLSSMEHRIRRDKVQEPRSKTVFRVAKKCRMKVKLTNDGWQIEP